MIERSNTRIYLPALALLFFLSCGSGNRVEEIDSDEIASLPSRHPIVLVNFWATWSAPSIQQVSVLKGIHFARKDIHIFGISMDEPVLEKEVASFLRVHQVPYPVYIKERESSKEKRGRENWLFGFDEIPVTHLFKNGALVYTFYADWEAKEMLKIIDMTPEELKRLQEGFYDYDESGGYEDEQGWEESEE